MSELSYFLCRRTKTKIVFVASRHVASLWFFFISTFNDDLSKQNGESSNVRSTGIMTALKNGGLSIVRAYGKMTA